MGQSTGRPPAIARDVIAGRAKKLSEESCELKTYKEMAAWVK
jgi:hypothetical protein